MSGYIFSIKPETFVKIEPLIQEWKELEQEMDKSYDEKKIVDLIKQQESIGQKIIKKLTESKERCEKLESFEDELDESAMVLDFKRFFSNEDPENADLQDNPAKPLKIKKYWIALEHLLKKDSMKAAVINYCKKTQTAYEYDIEDIDSVFKKWISILKHAADNENWYYHFVGEE